jgi:hypothetical protein
MIRRTRTVSESTTMRRRRRRSLTIHFHQNLIKDINITRKGQRSLAAITIF